MGRNTLHSRPGEGRAARIASALCIAVLASGLPAPRAGAATAAPVGETELKASIARIDMPLYERSEADIRAWLDARIAASQGYGAYEWGFDHVRIEEKLCAVNLYRGALADSAAQFFRAYEMLGDRKYLKAGLKTADLYLKVQQPAGHFPCAAEIARGGRVKAVNGRHPPDIARFEDGLQFRPFALLLYAWRLTDEEKYLDAARRHADMVLAVQHDRWGYLPDYAKPGARAGGTFHDARGVTGGGSYSDYATTDGVREMILIYHATGERKYLEKALKVGDWMFATQLGQGAVRGWADNYDADNRPVTAREHEGLMIEPRVFNRFTGPMLAWFHAIDGEVRYRTLFEETYAWMRDLVACSQ